MLTLPDATLAELLPVWQEVVEDIELIDHMPEHVAEMVQADFDLLYREMLLRVRRVQAARQRCRGHDGWQVLFDVPNPKRSF